MCSMWALEGTHSDMHQPEKVGHPMSASVRMGDKGMTDKCVSHGILFCCSILLILLQSLAANDVPFELGFKPFFTFPSLVPYWLLFGF